MGRLIFLLIFIASVSPALSQLPDSALLSLKITNRFSDFTIDPSGNIYLVFDDQRLKKLNDKGDSVAVYNDVKQYGKITSVDATNPLKILVFYKQTSVVVILDRFLAVKQSIDLRKNKIQQATLVKLAYDNNIWVYDQLDSKIKKIDDNGKLLSESADLRNVFSPLPSFDKMIDDNRSLYFYDPARGWFVFDYYGAFIKKYLFANWNNTQVINGTMLGTMNNVYISAKQGEMIYKETKTNLPFLNSSKVIFTQKKVYISYADRLEVFTAP